jgi:hypothetical protein
MSKVLEMASKERAPLVAEQLASAESVLAQLEAQIAQCALDEAEGVSGAAAKMATLNAKVSAGRAERHKKRQALRLALEIDRRNEVAARSKIRASQFAAFQNHGQERIGAAQDILKAAAAMSAAMQRYGRATQQMVSVKPVSTSLPMMGMGVNGSFGPALGNLEGLIASEFYRCCAVAESDDGQRFFVPFSKLATFDTDHTKMQPGFDVFLEAHNAIVAEISAQISKADAADLAIGRPDALKGAAA